MFPLKTTVRVHSPPVITWLLIAINIYVFVMQFSVDDPVGFVYRWGLVPANYPGLFRVEEAGSIFKPALLAPFITSLFLHGGLWHLLGNLLSLFVFGPNIEDRFGHVRFLLVYLACGLAAGITQIAFSAGSEIPIVGASGAIAGVMGAFFLLFPGAKVVCVIPVWIIPFVVRVPAVVFLLFWIAMNVFNAVREMQVASSADSAGVAWWAHIGGFAIGMVYATLLARRHSEGARDPDD
jgi:membrane associated rhomboid family serine protease